MYAMRPHRLGDRERVILRQRVRGSVRAVRAVRNTRVFLTETRVVADVTPPSSTSAISSSIPPLTSSFSDLALRLSAVLFVPVVGPIVCLLHTAGSFLLFSHATLMASAIFAHLMLNAM